MTRREVSKNLFLSILLHAPKVMHKLGDELSVNNLIYLADTAENIVKESGFYLRDTYMPEKSNELYEGWEPPWIGKYSQELDKEHDYAAHICAIYSKAIEKLEGNKFNSKIGLEELFVFADVTTFLTK